jgi:hypothetical protein
MLWQGSPEWKRLALTAFHVRAVGVYFALLAAWGLLSGGSLAGVVATGAAGVAAVGLLCLLAWLSARSAVYTITDRRIVLRVGVALPTCFNIPLKIVGTAALRRHPDGSADIPLQLNGPDRLGWLMLWPHARPWRLSTPEPMLRAVPDGEAVAALLARALADAVPEGRRVGMVAPAPARAPAGEVQAA